MPWVQEWLARRAEVGKTPAPSAPIQIITVCLLVSLALTLPGCDRPEGLGTVDADAARQVMVAQGQPDPLAPAGQAQSQVPPKAPKRPRPAGRR